MLQVGRGSEAYLSCNVLATLIQLRLQMANMSATITTTMPKARNRFLLGNRLMDQALPVRMGTVRVLVVTAMNAFPKMADRALLPCLYLQSTCRA